MNSILVVRRDNIGDLVCTTRSSTRCGVDFRRPGLEPSLTATTRQCWTAIRTLTAYSSTRSSSTWRAGNRSLGALRQRLDDLWALRRRSLDCVVVATAGRRTTHVAPCASARRPAHSVAFAEAHQRDGGPARSRTGLRTSDGAWHPRADPSPGGCSRIPTPSHTRARRSTACEACITCRGTDQCTAPGSAMAARALRNAGRTPSRHGSGAHAAVGPGTWQSSTPPGDDHLPPRS